jgi:hypothetical protein
MSVFLVRFRQHPTARRVLILWANIAQNATMPSSGRKMAVFVATPAVSVMEQTAKNHQQMEKIKSVPLAGRLGIKIQTQTLLHHTSEAVQTCNVLLIT